MARGDTTVFEEAKLALLNGTLDLDTQTIKIALVTTLPAASLATPTLADLTEVTGSGYTAGGETLTISLTETGGTVTFDATGAPAVTWSQNGSGPTNIMAGVIYEDTSGSDNLIAFVDFSADGGTTAISLQDGDITYTPNASGIFTLA